MRPLRARVGDPRAGVRLPTYPVRTRDPRNP